MTGMGFQFVTGLVLTLGTAAVLYVGGLLALEGVLTPGTIVVFVSYVASLYDPIESLSHTAQTIQSAAAETDRVMEIMEIEPAVADRARRATARSPARSATRTSASATNRGGPCCTSISFGAEPGEVLAIVGPTGAGKTTLASLLVRFFDPWQGRITIGGTDLRDFTLHSLRSQIALVLQDPFIFPISIAENIALGRPDAPREEIVAAAEAANAHTFIERPPERLRHAGRRAGRDPLRRREAAAVDRARVPARTHRC